MNITMVIECPKCGTKYKVIQEAIKPRGRTVHCTTCSNKWHVDPVEAAPDTHDHQGWDQSFHPDPFVDATQDEADDFPHKAEPEDIESTAAEPVDPDVTDDSMAPARAAPDESFIVASPKIASEPDAGHAGRGASFAVLAASLVLLAVGLFSLHGPIERAWPPAGRLYQLAGIGAAAAPGQGLDLQDVHARLSTETGTPVLTIEAKVINTLKITQAVPALDATLISDNGPAKHWSLKTDKPLDSGGSTSVKASFDGANTENGKILLTFSADNSVKSK